MPAPKPMASLTSGLLARKGEARPAMRPQGFVGLTHGAQDDLGWNDMGEDVSLNRPAVLRQIDTIEEQMARSTLVRPEQVSQPEVNAPEADVVVAEANPPVALTTPMPPVAEPVEPPVTKTVHPKPKLPSHARKSAAPRTAVAGKKAAFTLRLEAERHLRLRLASAITRRSSQQLVTQALDDFLATLPEISALARHVDSEAEG